jgi:hypothetical protein
MELSYYAGGTTLWICEGKSRIGRPPKFVSLGLSIVLYPCPEGRLKLSESRLCVRCLYVPRWSEVVAVVLSRLDPSVHGDEVLCNPGSLAKIAIMVTGRFGAILKENNPLMGVDAA